MVELVCAYVTLRVPPRAAVQDEIVQFQRNVTVEALTRLREVNGAVETHLAHLTEMGMSQVARLGDKVTASIDKFVTIHAAPVRIPHPWICCVMRYNGGGVRASCSVHDPRGLFAARAPVWLSGCHFAVLRLWA